MPGRHAALDDAASDTRTDARLRSRYGVSAVVEAGLVVTLKTGELIRGMFAGSNQEALVLRYETGHERTVRKVDVLRALGEKRDTILDGLLIGAAIGAGAGVLKGYDARTFECRAPCSIAIGTTLFTPIGALIGWLRDRHIRHSEVLYPAPP